MESDIARHRCQQGFGEKSILIDKSHNDNSLLARAKERSWAKAATVETGLARDRYLNPDSIR